MADFTAKDVAELRKKTGAGMMECKKALTETGGDMEAAVDLLRKKGSAKADKRAGRDAKEGVIGSYIHFTGRVGVMVELNCETDFVALTDDFQTLAKDISLHIASANPMALTSELLPEEFVTRERKIIEEQVAESGKPDNVREMIVEGKLRKLGEQYALLEQPFVKDDKQTVGDVITSVSAKVGENIVVGRFVRFEVGDSA
jgi:elongation factor Ts